MLLQKREIPVEICEGVKKKTKKKKTLQVADEPLYSVVRIKI